MPMFEIRTCSCLSRPWTAPARIRIHQAGEVELGLSFDMSRTVAEGPECGQDEQDQANQQNRAHRHDWKFYCDVLRRESSSREALSSFVRSRDSFQATNNSRASLTSFIRTFA